MSSIRCPLCGKPNPEELEECQFCQARLKPIMAPMEPLIPESTEGGGSTEKAQDLLAGLAAQAGEDEEVIPDWLADLRIESSPDKGAANATPEPPEPGKEEDWLTSLRDGSDLTAESPDAKISGSKPVVTGELGGVLPEWLTDLHEESAKEPFQPVVGDLTDWQTDEAAKEISSDLIASTEDYKKPASSSNADIPEWLAKLTAEQTSKETKNQEAAQIESTIPAEPSIEESKPMESPVLTMAGIHDGVPVQDGGLPKEPAAPAENPPESTTSEGEETSDLLSDLDKETAGPSPEKPPETLVEDTSAEIPEWLSSWPAVDRSSAETSPEPAAKKSASPLETLPSSSAPALIPDDEALPGADVDELLSKEMPDWLSSVGAEEREQEKPAEGAEIPLPPEQDESLTPAELPSWVQAMRPLEAVIPGVPLKEVGEKIPEKEGPLAGLSGILPTGPAIDSTRKPHPYGIKLQVSQRQQEGAALLETMLASESEPRPIIAPTMELSKRVLRWAIAGILFVVVGVSTFTRIRITPMAGSYPPQVGAAKDVINALSASDPVLLVFDYQPGLSGELDAAAAPVVDHLMLRGVHLTILSTSPTGPVLAERFLQKTQSVHDYQRGGQYINLGYLPGGSAGVLNFALNPTNAILLTVDGQPAWKSQPLQGVHLLSDFAALIIITDNAETGRSWIEQAGTFLRSSPMVMVVSAQTEPLLLPYYESDQVKGLVSGLVGAAAYEYINGRPALGYQYWDSFSIGLLAAELIILIGGLWGLRTSIRSRGKPEVDIG